MGGDEGCTLAVCGVERRDDPRVHGDEGFETQCQDVVRRECPGEAARFILYLDGNSLHSSAI